MSAVPRHVKSYRMEETRRSCGPGSSSVPIVALLVLLMAGLLLMAVVRDGIALGASSVSDREMDEAIEGRAPYGLRTDREFVRDLLSGAEDVGTADWGIPMTRMEADEINLSARVRFADRVSELVLPYLRTLPTYAGSYFDQVDGGRLVILLTKRDDHLIEEIDARMPEASRGRRIEVADTPFSKLEDALERADVISEKLAPSSQWVSAGIDTQGNRLRISFTPDTIEAAKAKKDAIADALGVRVYMTAAQSGNDTENCGNGNSRENCWNPIRAGVVIHLQSTDGAPCTMGFHIKVPGADPEEQWITAGHCGYDTTPNAHQYHSEQFHGGDRIGVREATLYNETHHRDMMRVGHKYPAEISSRIYDTDTPSVMEAAGEVQPGETVCASLGETDGNRCRVVVEVSTSWKSETWPGELKVYGASSMIPVDFGDSGAPVYRKYQNPYDHHWHYVPLGIMNHEPIDGREPYANSYFAKVKYALDQWDATIYKGN